MTTGAFSEQDFDFSDLFGSDDGVDTYGSVGGSADFLSGDGLVGFGWDDAAASAAAAPVEGGDASSNVLDVVGSFLGGRQGGRTLVGAL